MMVLVFEEVSLILLLLGIIVLEEVRLSFVVWLILFLELLLIDVVGEGGIMVDWFMVIVVEEMYFVFLNRNKRSIVMMERKMLRV